LDTFELREKVWQHLRENAERKGIFINAVGGYTDHCHCLISLGNQQSMSNVMFLLKGESSYWINKNKLCKRKFEWQDEYYALGVSTSAVPRVRAYIKRQEEHHGKQKCGFTD
jgi:putative transposase